jgi:hypothetical protein
MNKISKIYSILYKEFGLQGWLSFTLENELHPKHHGKVPKNNKGLLFI